MTAGCDDPRLAAPGRSRPARPSRPTRYARPARAGLLLGAGLALTLLVGGCGSGSSSAAADKTSSPNPLTTAAGPTSAAAAPAAAPTAPIAVAIPAAGHRVPGQLTVPGTTGTPARASTARSKNGAGTTRTPVVLLLHGDGGDDTGPGNMFGLLANRLAARGIATLRIDFAGSGRSEQPQTALDYPGMVADTTAALGYLAADPRFDPTRTALLGYSRGGTVAATVAGRTTSLAGRNASLAALVSWSGLIADGTDENPTAHRSAQASGSAVVGGWDFSLAWFDTIEASHALRDVAGYRGPELAVVGDRDGVVAPAVSENFIAVSTSPDKTLHVVAGADHGMGAGTPLAAETLAVTVDWLADRLAR